MYAVIANGGKQYKVKEGQILRLEKIEQELGESIEIDDILMLVDGEKISVGKPTVSGAKIVAKIEKHGRAAKIEILKFKRRKHHMKRMGHRQWYTEVKVVEIQTA
ncbi:MAG: 50S ribosomal protein L21 [Francisellaceae bacterium]|jgi:large subunit ribosomal protein L21|nr:50S ribosomal protein L21 [Francisellaceae bacterium]MBT6207014.1 50S ribosomal protein L21 [Francisellaceae bacterium]MBT6538623.1 50S ribosomal protein L21 [Francisellaceae bacterium]